MSIVTEARDIHIARIETDVQQCWPAFHELRSHLQSEDEFVERWRKQVEESYQIVYVKDGDKVVAVARARGIRLGEDVIPRTLAFVESLPASGTASMQRDIVDGRPSELEEIIGAVVRLGDQIGVPTPTTDCVYASLLLQELRARGGS
jgi:hypothetical protein